MDTNTLKISFYKFLFCAISWISILFFSYQGNVSAISIPMILLFLVSCRYLFMVCVGYCCNKLEQASDFFNHTLKFE